MAQGTLWPALAPPPGPLLLECRVEGTPRPWRVDVIRLGPRASVRLARLSDAYQSAIGVASWLALGEGAQLDVPVRVELDAVFNRPRWVRKLGPGRQPHRVAPDLDKIARNVLDGLQRAPTGRTAAKAPRGHQRARVGVLRDDCLVVELAGLKTYAEEGEVAHTQIRILGLG